VEAEDDEAADTGEELFSLLAVDLLVEDDVFDSLWLLDFVLADGDRFC